MTVVPCRHKPTCGDSVTSTVACNTINALQLSGCGNEGATLHAAAPLRLRCCAALAAVRTGGIAAAAVTEQQP